jgi:hypothetical protein
VISSAKEDFRMTVIVLPKLWKRRQWANTVHEWGADQSHLVISTYELARVRIEVNHPVQAELCRGLEKAAKNQDGLSKETLLVQEFINDGLYELDEQNDAVNYSDLFSLCCLYNTANYGNNQPLLGTSVTNKVLQLFTMKQFIDELKPLLRFLRQSYLQTQERTTSLRGRITGKGMIQHVAEGSLMLECEFDEFTANIPLYRVMMTAITVVESQTQTSIASVWSLQREAKQLRRNLSHIQSYTVNQAIQLGRQLSLNRLQQARWERPLKMALAILQDLGLLSFGHAEQDQGIVWNINTATEIWEKITLAGAEAAVKRGTSPRSFCIGQDENRDDLKIYDPWSKTETEHHGNGVIRPDIVLHDGQDLHCWDSKYKFIGNGTGSVDDRYQLFAYSHLVRHGIGNEGPTRLALLYPAMTGVGVRLNQTRMPPQPKPSDDVVLSALALPFPSRETVQNQNSWRRYLHDLTQTLRNFVDFKA